MPVVGQIIMIAAPIILLGLFFVAYKINRTKLIPGFLFTCSMLSFIALFFEKTYVSENLFLRILFLVVAAVIVLIGLFGTYILIGFLFLNTRSILKKERFSLQHILTLILAVSLLCWIIFSHFVKLSELPYAASVIFGSVSGIITYYFLHVAQYIISTMLCNFSRPKKNQDYIIVLGSWVKDGKVTPLLASRVDKAIAFYHKQKKERLPPKLLLSGGKGTDETCSEAQAMKDYALSKGLPEQDILLEDQSISTLENMKFSKKIMDGLSNNQPYKCIYATNSYHLLRAGIYARKAGLNINGIGSKTRLYYFPNALLREYIAYLYMHIKWNIAFIILSLLVGAVLPILLEPAIGPGV